MLVNHAALLQIFTGFKTNFQSGFAGVTPTWSMFSTEVPSSTEREFYAWLEDFPAMREWLGARQYKDVKAESYSITNRKFESTVSVKREKIEDDTFGTYAPLFTEMGAAAQRQKDELMYETLLAGDGANGIGFDGVSFFDASHPYAGTSGTSNNIDTNAGTVSSKWYVMDLSRPLKPLIMQNRINAELLMKSNPMESDDVFNNDRFAFGARARNAGGYGFWQMAYQSINDLNETNLDAVIAEMANRESDNGAKLGVVPTHLVCGYSRRAEALNLLKRENDAAGASNRSFQALELMITPYLP